MAAGPQDASDITTLWNTIIRDSAITFTSAPKTTDEIIQMILERHDGGFFSAHTSGRFVGFATFGPFRGGDGYRHTAELSIMLTPDARHTGTAAALLETLLAAAKTKGIHTMTAGISASNAAAIAFHAKHRFTEVGRLREVGRKFDQWHDLVFMQRML